LRGVQRFGRRSPGCCRRAARTSVRIF
jgi:hypothetical protein